MVETIHQIITITDEEILLQEFYGFETSLESIIMPLRANLAKQVLSADVVNMETHMTYVEAWRDRIAQYLRLVNAFVEHAKSSHFILIKGKGTGITETDRTAYQKKLTAGMLAMQRYLLDLIDAIDSRVNLCKKLLGIEGDIAGIRRQAGARA